jgi:crotonobetainyl-CoA:carnitine CoA-transferase CaiB-like acyl-CoA transferase
VIGAPELGTDPNYKDNVGRLKHRAELVGKLTELTKKMKRDDLLAKLEAVKVPAGPINNLEQVFADAQVKHRGMKLELKSKMAKNGTIPGVRSPIVIDGWKAASEKPSPLLGEHTQEVLREIGEG